MVVCLAYEQESQKSTLLVFYTLFVRFTHFGIILTQKNFTNCDLRPEILLLTWKHREQNVIASRGSSLSFDDRFPNQARRCKKDSSFLTIFKVNPLEFKVKIILFLRMKRIEVYLMYNSCLNVEDMSLNTRLGRQV